MVSQKILYDLLGLNSRLDTIEASLLLVKFEAFKEYELDRVNEVAKRYSD